MILITSSMAIALVYYFHGSGAPYAFFIALCMEIGFLLYIFNFLKEMEDSYEEKQLKLKDRFEKKEKELEAELENTKAALSACQKKNMEMEMLETIRKKQTQIKETPEE